MPKMLTKFERKQGFYCKLTQEQLNKKDHKIFLEDLHYDDLEPNKTGEDEPKTYFVYYDSKIKGQGSLERIYEAIERQAHYTNEHLDDIKWCQENKDVLQPLIKQEFDDKFGKYGEDFKFDLDIFNYAFLGKDDPVVVLAPEGGSAPERKEAELTKINKEIDEMMLTAAKNNTDLDLKGAINKLGDKLKNMEQEASSDKCGKAMRLAMAHYAHKIIALDISKEEKKKLFGDILVSYKDTMATMIATIGGYGKGYTVGNIDFGCLEANNLIKDLNEVVPTEFYIDVTKDADKNKNIDEVIETSLKNKKLAVEDKEFIGQSYKVAKEKYDKRNDFVKWLAGLKIPFLFPSAQKERETIEKIESFADKFDLGKTKNEMLENLTGITNAKKNKVVIDMADNFVKSAEIDVNGAMKTMQGIFGIDDKIRTINNVQGASINQVINRFYAGKALNKISELPGVSDYYSPIDKQEIKAQTENTIYQRQIAETADAKISAESKRQFAYVYLQASEMGSRETDLLTVSVDNESGKTLQVSLEKKVAEADVQLAKLDYDVWMKDAEVKAEQNYVSEQKDFKDLSNLGNDVSDNNQIKQQESIKSPKVEKITEKEKEEVMKDHSDR